MPAYKTHITILQEIATQHPDSPAFQVPEYDSTTQRILRWHPVSYSRFLADVEHFARYWSQKLATNGIPRSSVVGVWLGGMTYVDVLHIYSIVRAGYIPQLFSLKLPNPDVIFELLQKSNGKALIYDLTFGTVPAQGSVKTWAAVDARAEEACSVPLPPVEEGRNGDETLMIFHTSGSTSGRPKLVPCSYSWWDFNMQKAKRATAPHNPARKDVTTWMGSMCHIGQTIMFAGAMQHAACTIQPSCQAFPSAELMDMIALCGLNRLVQFPTYLAIHLRNSRRDPKLLAMLQGIDQIFYSGLKLSQEDEEWVHRNGMKIVNCFGNTECTIMLLSDPEWKGMNAPLTPVPGTSYAFMPLAAESEKTFENANARLLELVILSSSLDCPDRSLRAADGHYHTGDLFLEVGPGRYVSRGRDDDWIKSENSLRCDTKAIEDNVRQTCADLIENCIVVGNGRPSPALFVEVKAGLSDEKVKKDIIRRTRQFHSRRYLHERITSPNFIIVVPQDTLPRTASKGNIRRQAVEEAFKSQLDRLYGVAH